LFFFTFYSGRVMRVVSADNLTKKDSVVMISRKLSAVSGLKSLAAAFVLFLPIIATAQTQNLLSQSAQSAKPQVLVFSDGGDDRTFGHATTDVSGNLYIASELGDPHFTNSFGIVKYSPQGKLLGAFHFNPSSLSNGFAADVKVDAAGNIYACGFSYPFGGLVISFDPSGETRWTQFIGDDRFSSMKLDESGNLYVGGDSAGAILVAELTTDGRILWMTQHQGATTAGAGVTALQLDSKGNVVVVGNTGNSELLQQTSIVKLNPHGDILWTRDFNDFPGSNKIPQGGAVDQNDGIYATGTALNVFTGEANPYTVKYDTDGNRKFLLTGAGIGGTAIAVDPVGDILLHGATLIKGETVATISKMDPAGKFIFAKHIPIEGKVTTDSQGNIYISGEGSKGFAVIKLNPEGAPLFNFNRPLLNFVSLDGIADSIIDPLGNLVVTGFGLPNGAGLDDILVLKLPKDFK
jgi:hypothetical protein